MQTQTKKAERHHQAKSSLLLPVSSEASDSFKDKVFGVMHCDDVSFAARRDNVIVKFGERMFAKLGNEKHHISHVSQKMRELGRLLLKVRETDPDIVSLQECIHPKQFDVVLEAVRSLAGFDPHTGRYKTPSLAIKLGQSLQKCALIIKADCIRMEDQVSEAQAEKFSELASIEWNHKVSSGARTSLYERKFNKPNMLPLSEDILKIQSKLSEVMEENKKLLISGENKVAWKTLAEVTLSKLILFNRRRSGEVQRILEVDFTKRRHCSSNSDVMDSLSQWEQTLCNKMERVEIKGKRGRKVPILLTKEMVEAMELLHSTRQGSGVSKENPYFFARVNHNSKEPLRGSDCLRKYALLADTKYPASLTSTKLRKQIATVSQIVSLKENELDVLAGFLGHDIRTHREYYRLPEDTLQMAKVARLLLVMEKGTVGSFKDKTLEEIEIPLDDPSYNDAVSDEETDDEDSMDEPLSGHLSQNETKLTSKEHQSEGQPSETEEWEDEDDRFDSDNDDDEQVQSYPTSKSSTASGRKVTAKQKAKWSPRETRAVEKHFAQHIRLMKVPRKHECDEAIRKYGELKQKTWKTIKYKVYSVIQSQKRQMFK